MIIGMDFGTTNSGLAVADGQVRLLPLDPANTAAPHVVRTVHYITREHGCFVGREAQALLAGAVDLAGLHRLGLARVSEATYLTYWGGSIPRGSRCAHCCSSGGP